MLDWHDAYTNRDRSSFIYNSWSGLSSTSITRYIGPAHIAFHAAFERQPAFDTGQFKQGTARKTKMS